MRANTNGLAAFQDNDLVRISDGADALCNDHTGSTLQIFGQCSTEGCIRAVVQSREGIVEDQNFGVSCKSTSNGKPLLLTTGYILATLGDVMVFA